MQYFSPLITCIVGLALGFYFNRKLENLKRSLNVEEKLLQRRVTVYQQIIAPIYNIRNILREFLEGIKIMNILDTELINTIVQDVEKLKEMLIDNRLDLKESDFEIIHTYKNKSIYLTQLLEDLRFYLKHNEQENVNITKNKLFEIFSEFNNEYEMIANTLSFNKLQTSSIVNDVNR